jgi:hypothetical protein
VKAAIKTKPGAILSSSVWSLGKRIVFVPPHNRSGRVPRKNGQILTTGGRRAPYFRGVNAKPLIEKITRNFVRD